MLLVVLWFAVRRVVAGCLMIAAICCLKRFVVWCVLCVVACDCLLFVVCNVLIAC